MANIKYRPDIDGLRAIAVLLVITFHFNKDILPSGFIGVDIFFVISGFIITSAIFPQMISGDFTFSSFYEKRIKRILPLFYLVAILSLVLAYILFAPNDFSSFADSLRYSSVFISNIYFEKSTGYFAPSSETMPLLHIWSLSVEEQFYFIWPIVLLVCVRYLPKKSASSMLILSMVALVGLSQFLALTEPSQAYFLIQGRAFEMLMGASLALAIFKAREKRLVLPNKVYVLTGAAGTLFLVLSLVYLDKSKIFPGLNAAIVCFGAVLLIFSGDKKDSPTSKFLSLPILVWIGRLSYSLYLWHWPVQAFYRYYEPEFGIKGFVICSALTLGLSLLSYKLVENPARYFSVKKKYVFIGYFLIPVVALVLIAKNIEKHEGYPNRFSKEAMALYYDSVSNIDSEKQSRKQLEAYEPFFPMLLGDQTKSSPSVFLWGDSHAQHFQPFVDELGKKYHFGALYAGAGGCPPIAEGGRVRYGELEDHCYKTNERALERILDSDAKVVFLGGRWATYTETTLAKNEEGRSIYLGDEQDRTESLANNRRVFDKGLEETISKLISHGKTPVIFGQVPSYSFKPSNCLVKKANYHWMAKSSCDENEEPFKERYRYFNDMLNSLKKKYPQLVIIDIPDLLCKDNKCVSSIDGKPIYKDNNHINAVGSRKIYEAYMASSDSDRLKALFAS
ncbi:acyltransferase family protein [Enterovibrio nigricans]|uniref:Peptidoglycan/LPS O-acetylase OafA/YrhL, contains acyltransferase and SGNH-hydrolase domains n=1 Tax=Enterovibrio nigricans DSM 22720 TaxID=1121868 RepID=A0A1T4UX01_9GAMM|nr:acyltransferase family protein [Enterovibrio nigricans]PKF50853.1 acyltransferase [Enterovibrio nigricans]SKA57166.1 Peptidoglycan/LPS O-acetylase OafA/YrhL, contains acyltransferase and SGNH-hydrolase domains [Enterovibrio nigricans DSM 22720]